MSHPDRSDEASPVSAPPRMPSIHARRAVSLVELLTGIVVAALVVLMAVSHVVRHQRAYDAIAAAIDLRTRLRDASALVVDVLHGSHIRANHPATRHSRERPRALQLGYHPRYR